MTSRTSPKRFASPDGTQLPVLEDISLSLREGEIVALLGRSGSGKSTLLRCIAGLIAPTSGEISYRGLPLNGANPGVSMVFQSFALLPWLTVRQNVELGLEALGVPAAERRERAERAIDPIGLDGFESAYPKELSGGMRQRVGFARALVVEPDALLMDEPFSALDVLTAQNLRAELLRLWREKTSPPRPCSSSPTTSRRRSFWPIASSSSGPTPDASAPRSTARFPSPGTAMTTASRRWSIGSTG